MPTIQKLTTSSITEADNLTNGLKTNPVLEFVKREHFYQGFIFRTLYYVVSYQPRVKPPVPPKPLPTIQFTISDIRERSFPEPPHIEFIVSDIRERDIPELPRIEFVSIGPVAERV